MLLEIPLTSTANQVFTTTVNSQKLTIQLRSYGSYVYASISLDGTQIITNVICNNQTYLNQYNTDLTGYLFFSTDDGAQPAYGNFGDTCHLYYSDFDALEISYENYVSENATYLASIYGIA
jgi:hypothetical protein